MRRWEGTRMIRGLCIAIDQETGRTCGRGMATYIDPEHGLGTMCEKHFWEAETRRRAREPEAVPESSGDRLALRLYGRSQPEQEG